RRRPKVDRGFAAVGAHLEQRTEARTGRHQTGAVQRQPLVVRHEALGGPGLRQQFRVHDGAGGRSDAYELIPGAAMAGQVLLDGDDIYDAGRKLTHARKQIGMVFQKPNPFPAMSIYDNVTAGLKLTGTRVDRHVKDQIVEECLTKAGLWREVRDRLRQ